MNNRVAWIAGLFFCVASIGACGSDKATTAGTDAGAKKDAGHMASADAGKTDAGSPKTDAGGPMAMTAKPVPCGSSKMCQPPAGISGLLGMFGGAVPGLGGAAGSGAAGGLGGFGLPSPVACCLSESSGACGTAPMTGGTCEAPATNDTRCPSVDLGPAAAFAGNMGFGCCTSSGQCGIDGAVFGRGCVPNTEAKTMLAGIPLVGMFLTVPAPQACEGGSDAGHPMSGNDAGL
jgi:hypothetical protein